MTRLPSLRKASVVAQIALVTFVSLTILVVGTGHAAEANPVTAAYIDALGVEVWAVLTPLLVGGLYALLGHIERHGLSVGPLDEPPHPTTARRAGWLVAGILVLVAIGDVATAALGAFPEVVYWPAFVPGLSLLVTAALMVMAGPWCIRRLRSPSKRARYTVAVVVAVFLVTQGAAAGVTLSTSTGTTSETTALTASEPAGLIETTRTDTYLYDVHETDQSGEWVAATEQLSTSDVQLEIVNETGQTVSVLDGIENWRDVDAARNAPYAIAATSSAGADNNGFVRFYNTDGTAEFTSQSIDFISGIGINDDGTRFVISSGTGTTVYDRSGTEVCSFGTSVGEMDYYSATDDFIAVPSTNGDPARRFDAETCTVKQTYSLPSQSSDNRRVSVDGADGVAYYSVIDGSNSEFEVHEIDLSADTTSQIVSETQSAGASVQLARDTNLIVATVGSELRSYNYSGTLQSNPSTGGVTGDVLVDEQTSPNVRAVVHDASSDDLKLYSTGVQAVNPSNSALTGTVTDQSGSPVPAATVSDGNGNSTTTDANGDYSLTLQNDTYTITASKRGYADESASVTIDGSDETQDFTLGPSSPPYVDAADPTGGEYLNLTDRQVNLNATVADDSGDSINATIYHNPLNGSGWTAVASETGLQSGEEINATVTASPGENQWKVETSDGVNSGNSSVYSWRVGSNMVIFNGSDLTLLDTRTVSVELNSTDSAFSDARTTSDGILELTGLPRERMRATLEAPDYVSTTIIVDDPSRPEGVILYPDDNSQLPGAGQTFTQCFSLQDQTGDFPQSTSVVGAQQYLNGSFETASADFFGASNEAQLTLQNQTLYRLIVANEQGDTKILGQFVADDSISSCIDLTIESNNVGTEQPGESDEVLRGNISNVSYVWDAYREDPDSGPTSLKFEFDIKNDTRQTSAFRLRMYEYQNESNEIVNTSLGVLNSVEYSEQLTSAEANQTWVVAWNATIDGEVVTGSQVLGAKQRPLGVPIDTRWKGWISAMGLVLVSGLFGGVRAKEGAVVIPLIAGILWYIDWLAPETGILAILGGLAIAVIIVYGTEQPTP